MTERLLPVLRRLVLKRMLYYLHKNFETQSLSYKLLADYPTRPGKGIRPALCLAATASVGGDYENSINTAAAIEFLHNAFLIKDDVVDESLYRRGDLTLNRKYGLALAANAGDAVKILSMSPLIDNLSVIGVRKSLEVILEIQEMASRSIEGQISELTYVRNNRVTLEVDDYFNLCENKTCWYTTIAPCRTGLIIGMDRASKEQLDVITQFARKLGLAFQITDDILNLTSTRKVYGKEIRGDLREGKRTLMLIHLLNSCRKAEKEKIKVILRKPRDKKSVSEISYLTNLLKKYSSINFAKETSRALATEAKEILKRDCDWMTDAKWKNFFLNQTDYLIHRKR